jgi:hypothetical protein
LYTSEKIEKNTKSKIGFWNGFRRFYGNLALPSRGGDFSAYFEMGEIKKNENVGK